jgi:hypothetical protein
LREKTQLVTTGPGAREVGITPSGLRWYIDTGRVRCIRVGALRLIPIAEIRRLKRLRERRAAASAQEGDPTTTSL